MSSVNHKKTIKTLSLLHNLSQSEGEKIAVKIANCQQSLTSLQNQIDGAQEESLREEEVAANGTTDATADQHLHTAFSQGSDMAAVTSSLSNYRAHHTAQITDLKQAIAEHEEELLTLRDALTVIFGEQKAYEITQDHLREQISVDLNRKNQLFLDDIASQQWQKRERSQHEQV